MQHGQTRMPQDHCFLSAVASHDASEDLMQIACKTFFGSVQS